MRSNLVLDPRGLSTCDISRLPLLANPFLLRALIPFRLKRGFRHFSRWAPPRQRFPASVVPEGSSSAASRTGWTSQCLSTTIIWSWLLRFLNESVSTYGSLAISFSANQGLPLSGEQSAKHLAKLFPVHSTSTNHTGRGRGTTTPAISSCAFFLCA